MIEVNAAGRRRGAELYLTRHRVPCPTCVSPFAVPIIIRWVAGEARGHALPTPVADRDHVAGEGAFAAAHATSGTTAALSRVAASRGLSRT